MSESIVEYSATWWVLMCSLGLAAVSVGALLISAVIPMLGSAIKELVRMFGRKKSGDIDRIDGVVSELTKRTEVSNIGGREMSDYREKILVGDAILRLHNRKASKEDFECLRATVRSIDDVVDANRSRVDQLFRDMSDLVTCESCKCLLRKCDAYRGESVIEKPSSEFSGYVYMDGAGALCAGGSATERIRERYYCAVHKPKGKK